MMIHMHVQKNLWFDAVLSAFDLINRMPSSVLHSKISFFSFYPNKSVFFTLLVFLAVRVLFRTCLMV